MYLFVLFSLSCVNSNTRHSHVHQQYSWSASVWFKWVKSAVGNGEHLRPNGIWTCVQLDVTLWPIPRRENHFIVVLISLIKAVMRMTLVFHHLIRLTVFFGHLGAADQAGTLLSRYTVGVENVSSLLLRGLQHSISVGVYQLDLF